MTGALRGDEEKSFFPDGKRSLAPFSKGFRGFRISCLAKSGKRRPGVQGVVHCFPQGVLRQHCVVRKKMELGGREAVFVAESAYNRFGFGRIIVSAAVSRKGA